MLRLLRLISYPQLRASWGRTALVIGGIATGISLIVAINVINVSVLAGFHRTIERIAGPAQLQVALGIGEVGFSESIVETVRADRAVAAAVPLVRGTIALADEPGTTLQLFGVDLTAEEELQRYDVTTKNRREILEGMHDPSSVLLTETFAHRRHIAIGDSVALAMPTGVRTFTVRGLLNATGISSIFGGHMLIMDLPAAQLALAKEERIDQLDIVLAAGASIEEVQRRLQAALPPTLTVVRPAQRGAEYDRVLGSFQAMLTGLSLLCLVAGIYIVYNTTSTAAVHRALVMAALRLQGADGPQAFRLLMLEAFVLGAIGVVIGMPLGVALARLLMGMVADSMGVIFQLRFPVDSLSIDFRGLPAIAAAGIGAAMAASYSAARRVAHLEPLAILRADLRSVALRPATSHLVGWWLILVLISAAALVLEVRLHSIAWGNFGSTLWFAASIVIAIPMVTASSVIFSRILPRIFGAEGRVAVESLFRSPVRTGVTVGAIALVVTVGITSASLSWSLSRNISGYFSGGFLACDMAVSAVTTDGGWLETAVPDELGSQLREIPGVQRAELIRILPGQVFRGERIAVGGISDGFIDPARYPPGWYRSGDPVRAVGPLKAGTAATISMSLADRFGLVVGDVFELDAPAGPIALSVAGIVPDYMSDRGSVILSRRLLVDHWQDHAVNRVLLYLDPGVDPELVRKQIGDRLGSKYALKVLLPNEIVAFHAAQVSRAFVLMDAIQLLIAVVTVAGILDLLLSSILERKRELSLWRMIGADERAVRRSIVIESATVGLNGVVLGIGLGAVTAWIWIGINFRYLLGYYLDYYFAWTSAAWFMVLVSGMTITAGYLAASAATRQSILDGLRVD